MHLVYGQADNAYRGFYLGTKRFFWKTEELLLPLVKPTWLLRRLRNFKIVEPSAHLSSQTNFTLQCDAEVVQFLNRKL